MFVTHDTHETIAIDALTRLCCALGPHSALLTINSNNIIIIGRCCSNDVLIVMIILINCHDVLVNANKTEKVNKMINVNVEKM